MSYDIIKRLLRESLLGEEESEDEEEKSSNDEKTKTTKRDYSDVVIAMDKGRNPTAPSQVGVMKAMGISDDKHGTNRSLFGKKLHQEKNEDGSLYQFDEDELAEIRAILNIS